MPAAAGLSGQRAGDPGNRRARGQPPSGRRPDRPNDHPQATRRPNAVRDRPSTPYQPALIDGDESGTVPRDARRRHPFVVATGRHALPRDVGDHIDQRVAPEIPTSGGAAGHDNRRAKTVKQIETAPSIKRLWGPLPVGPAWSSRCGGPVGDLALPIAVQATAAPRIGPTWRCGLV